MNLEMLPKIFSGIMRACNEDCEVDKDSGEGCEDNCELDYDEGCEAGPGLGLVAVGEGKKAPLCLLG